MWVRGHATPLVCSYVHLPTWPRCALLLLFAEFQQFEGLVFQFCNTAAVGMGSPRTSDCPFDCSSASDGCEHLALQPAMPVALVQFHWFAAIFCDLRQAYPGDFPPVQGDLSGWWNSSAGRTAAQSRRSLEWRLFLASVHWFPCV